MHEAAQVLLHTRPPEVVMHPARAGAVVPGPLSFARQAMRALVRERARLQRLRFDLDEEGRGEVLYRLSVGQWTFHFYCLSNKLPEDQKTDRNYAASWDAMGVLCQGEWTAEREAWLRREVPRQRAGYADYDTLVYARGNRSARLFDHVVDRLAAGQQPDTAELAPVGYILRTTAFIGNGQLGTRPLAGFEPDHPLRRPYQAQFTSAFVLREFLFDLVEHIARARSPHAVRLAPAFRRFIGLGNSAATGLIWFIVNHPHLMHAWSLCREQALARVLAQEVEPGDARIQRALDLLDKAARHHEESHLAVVPGAAGTGDLASRAFMARDTLAGELRRSRAVLEVYARSGRVGDRRVAQPWRAVSEWVAAHLSPETLEIVHAVWLELHPAIVDTAAPADFTPEAMDVQPAMSLHALRTLLQERYAWVRTPAVAQRTAHHFWYRTTRTPRDTRRAPRGREPAFEHETTMDTVLQVQRLWQVLDAGPADEAVARFVVRHPDLRHVVARVQCLAGLDYAEMREQWLASDFSPFGAVRFVLHFFGVEKFEAALPKSVRGTFLQGAPVAEDVAAGRDGDWPFVLRPGGGSPGEGPQPTAQAAVTDAPDPIPPTRVSCPELPHRRMAPGELARLVAAALQGHGAPLGVAELAAEMVVLGQSFAEPAVALALEQCARGALQAGAAAWHGAGDAAAERLQGHGSSALLWAADAGDLAAARAVDPAGTLAQVVVSDVRAPALAAPGLLRCARLGLLALMTWAEEAGGSTRRGWSAAGPGPEGPWWVTVPHGDPPAVLVAAVDAAGGAAPAPEGFTLWCSRPPGDDATAALFDAAACAAGAACVAGTVVLDSRGLRGHVLQAQRRGVAIDVAVLDRLTAAGAAVLVPHEHEHRILDPGFDPLKAF